ncbi:DUF5615 family PIN-like protein [Devosia sp.]|uniref:DUF5615 family PIN-like protein n=1 Tax=Devosia sp. TaxID=1871048 RepID=UPI001ACA1422|nr:DUF5615 family PIN-like protein [Devosia sp.]MBN9309972.1 DUF5615 family PIN-like protein [Devosia sp.]
MNLIVDMNLPPRLASSLRGAGHVAVHWSELGAADAVDSEILTYAVRTRSVILTHDLDFGSILAASGESVPSVVILRSDNLAVEALVDTIAAALAQFEADLEIGALLVVDASRTRARLLPIKPQ